MNSFLQLAVLGGAGALIAVAIACRVRKGVVSAAMLTVAVLLMLPSAYFFLMGHPELIDGRFRTYKAFYRDIRVGMSREQVFAVMERRYPKEGLRKRPIVMENTARSLGFFMDPETSREPNCEGIFLKLEQERVVLKTYSMD